MVTNYIAHLNGFKHRRRVYPLNASEIALYVVLMEHCNELGWMDWFCAPNGVLCGQSGLSEKAFRLAREGLCGKGYVEYRPGRGFLAAHYKLPDMAGCRHGAGAGADEGADERADERADEGAVGGAALNKQKEKEKEKPQHALAGLLETAEWHDYAQMRLKMKKPLGGRAVQMALDKLQKLAPGDTETQKKILNQSTFYCWKDLYTLERRYAGGAAGRGAPHGAAGMLQGPDGPPRGPDMDELAARSARQRRDPGWVRGDAGGSG